MFHGLLIAALRRSDRGKGSRPPFDPVLMFKILVLQALYRSKKKEAFLERGMFKSNIHQRRMPRRPLPEHIARANARRSAVRSAVEHVFAGQKHRMGLFIRTIGIARPRIKIGMANLAYNLQRLAWLEGRSVSIGVQSGPPIGTQKGPLCGCADRLMLGAVFALLAA